MKLFLRKIYKKIIRLKDISFKKRTGLIQYFERECTKKKIAKKRIHKSRLFLDIIKVEFTLSRKSLTKLISPIKSRDDNNSYRERLATCQAAVHASLSEPVILLPLVAIFTRPIEEREQGNSNLQLSREPVKFFLNRVK